ncbi:MAG: antibiotic biosynthesis monooxygenase [Planctomycetes bacterium]|nr:antibiotic biosynthesis monooxygenase [Planctomycetota bacterium]
MKTTLFVRWTLQAASVSRVLTLLADLAAKTRSEPGNLLYDVYQSESEPREIVLHEEYVDAEALAAHRQSPHYAALVVNGILPHLEKREVVVARKLL